MLFKNLKSKGIIQKLTIFFFSGLGFLSLVELSCSQRIENEAFVLKEIIKDCFPEENLHRYSSPVFSLKWYINENGIRQDDPPPFFKIDTSVIGKSVFISLNSLGYLSHDEAAAGMNAMTSSAYSIDLNRLDLPNKITCKPDYKKRENSGKLWVGYILSTPILTGDNKAFLTVTKISHWSSHSDYSLYEYCGGKWVNIYSERIWIS